MHINQTLKNCLVKFLASRSFNQLEFKHIRKIFIKDCPQFESKDFYQKIYQVFRELTQSGYITIDNSGFNFKYSSNYKESDLLNYLNENTEIFTIQDKLYKDYIRLEEDLRSARLEIDILSKYMHLYPVIVSEISACISDAQNNIKSLQSEIYVLDKLIFCISDA